MSDTYVTMTDNNFNDEIKSGITIVDFWAPWCGPCKMMGPVFEKLAGEYQGKVKFGKLNVDEHQEAARKYSVTGIPSLIIFKDGEESDKVVGFQSEAALKKFVDSQL